MESQIPKSLATLFLFLSITITAFGLAPSSSVRTAKPYIRKACDPTPYPRLCETSLTFYASDTKRTQQELCKAALISALKTAQNATSRISELSSQKGLSLSPYEAEVVEDCVQNLKDSIDELRKATDTIKNLKGSYNNVEFQVNGIKTWVSAAGTDVYTCTDGLDGGRKVSSKVKGAVKKSVLNLTRQISNALSLINNFKHKS